MVTLTSMRKDHIQCEGAMQKEAISCAQNTLTLELMRSDSHDQHDEIRSMQRATPILLDIE